MAVSSTLSPPLVVSQYSGCVDVRGQSIPHGFLFAPGPDECLICTCFNGSPGLCRTVLCAPPSHCKSLRVGAGCCEWICLDHGNGQDYDRDIVDGGVYTASPAADVNLRLVASAVTAICSVALLFFLIYRLRKKKLRNRQRRSDSQDDAMSMDSQAAGLPHPAYPMTALPPPPHTTPPPRSYWHSLAWWKPTSANDDIFEARPAPPSYDAAMQQAQRQRQQMGECCDDADSADSIGGDSLAPPYSEIHHDPIIIPPVFAPVHYSAAASFSLPAQYRAGAALVLPVPPPRFNHLSHVAAVNRPRSQMDEREVEQIREIHDDDDDGEAAPQGQSSRVTSAAAANATRSTHSTLPHVIRRMRARSREAIVMPPEERDAVLQRFSLQLQLNISASSSDTTSSANSALAVPLADDGLGGVGGSQTSISSGDQY